MLTAFALVRAPDEFLRGLIGSTRGASAAGAVSDDVSPEGSGASAVLRHASAASAVGEIVDCGAALTGEGDGWVTDASLPPRSCCANP